MNLFKKFYNWDKSPFITWGIIFLVLLAISTNIFINKTFKVDYDGMYKKLDSVMEENRANIESLVNEYKNGNITIGNDYSIYFSKENVSISCIGDNNIFEFKEEYKIQYNVIKRNNSYYIDDRYIEINEVLQNIGIYIVYILCSLLISIFGVILIAIILDFIVKVYKKRKYNKT